MYQCIRKYILFLLVLAVMGGFCIDYIVYVRTQLAITAVETYILPVSIDLESVASSVTDIQPQHSSKNETLHRNKILQLSTLNGSIQTYASKRKFPSQNKSSSTSTMQPLKNHTSSTTTGSKQSNFKSKKRSLKLIKGDYSPLDNQTTNSFRSSFEDLYCESGPLCPGTGCTSQLSYLWNMTHLYAAFHAKGIELLRSGQSQSVKTLTWYCDTLGSCGGMGYQFQGLTTTWILGMLTGRVVLFRWHQKSIVSDYLSPNMIDWRFMNYKLKGSSVNVGDFVKYRGKNIAKYHQILMEALTSKATHVQMHFNKMRDLNDLIFNSDIIPSKHIPGIVLPPSRRFIYSVTELISWNCVHV